MSENKAGKARDSLRTCSCCGIKFIPHPRLLKRQKTCAKPSCQKFHRAQYRRRYRTKNSEAERGYQKKQKDNRPVHFWKKYRIGHPEYTIRNRAQSRLHKKLKKRGLQRQLDILQLVDPIDKLGIFVEFATSHRSLFNECRIKPAA